MSLPKYNPTRDANEPEIIQTLEAGGASVDRLNTPVDLLVGFRGRSYAVECKSAKGKLTPHQERFIDRHNGAPVYILRSVEDALNWINERKHG